MFQHLLRLTALTFVLTSCSSFHVDVVSEPSQADVYLKNGKQLKKIGQTPLKLDNDQLSGFDAFQISIQKKGYQSRDIYLQTRTLSANAKIHTTLVKEESVIQGKNDSDLKDFEYSQRQVASIQTQILEKNFQQAETLARSFLDDHPYSAVGWNLLGNTFLLQNRNQEALRAYSRALEYDPENKETKGLIRFLRDEPSRRER